MEQKFISRRSFLRLSGVGIAGALLAACAPVTPAPAPAAKEAAKPAAPPAKEFVLWGLQYDPHVERYQMLAEAFEKKTGNKATIEPQGWPIEPKVLAGMAAGVVPDVVCIMGKASVPLFLQKAVIEVDDVVFKAAGVDIKTFFTSGSVGAYFWEGHHYGVPVEDNSSAQAAAARTDWVEEAGDAAKALWPAAQGKDRLESYQQMWDLAELLQRKDDQGNVTAWGLSSQGWDSMTFLSIMRQLGRMWWDPDNRKFYLDSEEAIEALKLHVTTPVFERKIETQLDMSHMDALLAGKVAVARGNNAMAGEAAKINVPVESVEAPPAVPGETPLYVGEGGWGFEVPVQAKNKDIGIEFLKFMCTYEAQYIYAGIYGGAMTASLEVAKSDIYQGDDPVKKSVRRDLMALPNTVYFGWGFGLPSEMQRIVDTVCAQVRTGELQPPEAVKQMQVQLEEHHKQFLEGKVPVS